MATTTTKLALPRPESTDIVTLANEQALIDAIDAGAASQAEVIAHLADTTPHTAATNLIKTSGGQTIAGTTKFSTSVGVNISGAPVGEIHAETSGTGTTVTTNVVGSFRSKASGRAVSFQFSDSLIAHYITYLNSVFEFSGNIRSPLIKFGTGSPEGAVTAGIGAIYLRTDGGASTTLYVKESGVGNTGWIAK